jgi:hypothetical protein
MSRLSRTWLLVGCVAVGLAARPVRADDTHECVVASDQGQQLRDDGKLAAARERFVVCARDACPALVRTACQKWLSQVTAEQPTVIIGLRDAAGHDIIDSRVFIDGVLALSKLDGSPLRLDPGPHVFRFEATGFLPVEQSILARQAETNRVITAILNPVPDGSGPAIVPLVGPGPSYPPGGAESERPASVRAVSLPPSTRKWNTLGWALGGAGLVGLSLGIGFGVAAITFDGDAHCNPSMQCLRGPLDSARTAATGSSVGFIAGGVLLAGGVTLVLVMPRRMRPSDSTRVGIDVGPLVGRQCAGLTLGASF